MTQLTHKQQSFIDAYTTNGFNAAQAAITAKYSPKGANSKGSQLLATVSIQAAIAEKLAPMLAAANVDAQKIFKELGICAFSDLGDICKWDKDGLTLIDSKDLEPEHRRMIAKVESHTRTTTTGVKNPQTETNTIVKVTLHSKIKGLETLARCYKLINTEKQQSNLPPGSITINLAKINIEMKAADLAPKVV